MSDTPNGRIASAALPCASTMSNADAVSRWSRDSSSFLELVRNTEFLSSKLKNPVPIPALKEKKLLDAVGGYAFLTQVSSRIPTTAQAGFFIEKVRDTAAMRQAIREFTEAVDRIYDLTGGGKELEAVQALVHRSP